jgi:hypothetical protein
MKTALWLVFAMHIFNCVETIMNIFGLEKKLCSGVMLCGFFVFEITTLIYMQVIYFESMEVYCGDTNALLYYWLMA